MVKEVTSGGSIFQSSNGKANNSPVRVLDLATGTADVAIVMAKEYQQAVSTINDSSPKKVEILGVDPSQNMIDIGKEKVSTEMLSEVITLDIGDARNLSSLKDNSFQIATMSFGIRNVPEKEQALCEIYRVLKKDKKSIDQSKLAILEFSEPGSEAGIMGFFARLFIRHVVPIVGAILSGAPQEYMHLQNSIKEFPSPIEFKALMEGLSCGKRNGSFRVDNLINLNFGSVQLYIATPIA